jgi:MoaA/NifB/PqqE/SkfB family radical SAM enzyme
MAFKFLETDADASDYKLRSVELAITSKCNFRCSYCCAYDLNERQVLTGAAAIEIIKDLPDLQRVKLSGGEVLIRFEDCLEVVKYCAIHGIETQINTNGTLLHGDRVRILEDAGLNVLHFSLDFDNAADHSQFYKVDQRFFGRITEAIETTVASSIDAVAETIIFNETKDRLVKVHNFIGDLGVQKHEIQMEIPGVHEGYKSTIAPDDLAEYISNLIDHRQPDVNLYFSCVSAYIKPNSPNYKKISKHYSTRGVSFASCIEGKNQLHVHSTGDVMICELGAPEIIGNVFETPLSRIVGSEPEQLKAFIKKHHLDGAHMCFRHCNTPGEVVFPTKGAAAAVPPKVELKKPDTTVAADRS